MPADPFNVFDAFLNEVPEVGYFSYRDQARSPNQKRFFDQEFQAVEKEVMGGMGEMGGGGEGGGGRGGGGGGGGPRFTPPTQFNYGTQRPGL